MKVTFQIQGTTPVTTECSPGQTLLEVARRAGVGIDAPCSGNGDCGKCRVKLLAGRVDALPGGHISPEEFQQGWRLSCESRTLEDCTVFVPQSFASSVKLADLVDPKERAPFDKLLQRLQEKNMGSKDTGAGLALDVGTTTVCGLLADLSDGKVLAKGVTGNGQIRYGADVINRILESIKPGGKKALQDAVVQLSIQPLVKALCQAAKISQEEITRVSVAANTTMNHLLVGLDADPIRLEDYDPDSFNKKVVSPRQVGIPGKEDVCFAPNVGAYVGGDITAGIFAGDMWEKDEMSLFIDLGTNGEIVLGNRELLLTCACSAGPAFEGGQISCGMRASDGAVESVEIDSKTMEPTLTVVGGGKPAGICGSGLIDMVAQLFSGGIINARGRFCRQGDRIARDEYGASRYVFATAQESRTGRELSINEIDIDNFIRAKGAIFSGIEMLLMTADISVRDIDKIYVAGGIGAGINLKNALRIGMLPEVAPEKYTYVGNAALTGAYGMLLGQEAQECCRQVAANMTYIDLSGCPGYMDRFVAACFLPHTDESLFPNSMKQ